MIRASIDLGTNTCLLLIAEIGPDGVQKILEDHARIVRLGQGVDHNRVLQEEAKDRAIQCLREYASAVKKAGVELADVICLATSQARDAGNSAEFFSHVEREIGFRFQVISGEEEAQLTFLGGLLPGMNPKDHAVIDIGGGSTEIITHSGGQSLDVGSVRFTERFLKSDPVTDEEFWNCQDAIDLALLDLRPWREEILPAPQLVAVAGTATTLAAWYLGLAKFDASQIDGVTLTRGDVHRQVEELKWRTVRERSELPGVEAQRADVLLAGALILWRTLEILEFKNCKTSTRGLRFGGLHPEFTSLVK